MKYVPQLDTFIGIGLLQFGDFGLGAIATISIIAFFIKRKNRGHDCS